MRCILFTCLVFNSLCGSSQTNKSAFNDSVKGTTWKYGSDTDKMTDVVNYVCHINAAEKLNFSSPYRGSSLATIYVENIDGVNYFAFCVPKGRFNKSSQGEVTLRIRFDVEQPGYYKFYIPKDTRINIAAIDYRSANKMIEKLKKAKRVRIQADYDNGGEMISEFNVAGLKWNHKGKEINATKPGQERPTDATNSGSNIFEQYFSNPGHTKTTVTSTATSDEGNNVTSKITINGTTVNTKEIINGSAHTVTLACTCQSSNKGKSTVTIKAYFMDADKNVLDTKSATLTCTGNSEISTNLIYTDTEGKYKSYRIEVQ